MYNKIVITSSACRVSLTSMLYYSIDGHALSPSDVCFGVDINKKLFWKVRPNKSNLISNTLILQYYIKKVSIKNIIVLFKKIKKK